MTNTVEREIRQFIVENFLFGQESTAVGNDESFLDTGIVDSTGILQLVGFIEQRYGIKIADHELIPDNLDSISKVSSFVSRKHAAGEFQTPRVSGASAARAH